MHCNWKDTLVVLIPKIKFLVSPSNFRPISLCQTIYKIATTMLVNRLKCCIDKFISAEQVAFIPGRSLYDHFLLALEIFNKFKISKHGKGLMVVKLDMAQAFDCMSWETLKLVLNWFGYPENFSLLVLECVTNVHFSILLNGKSSRWIEAKSGFRQGCLMSPYLYILCSQLLTNVINKRGHHLGIHTSPRAPRITHLLYADDILLFNQASSSKLRIMLNLIRDYCGWTRQGINKDKSQILFSNSVRQTIGRKIGKKFGIKIVDEFQYLGIRIALRWLVKSDFDFVVDPALEKLNTWSARSLSIAGRMTLAKSSLLSLPTFISSHSLIPKSILYELDRIYRDFIWHHNSETRGLHYVSWDDFCVPRAIGGMGLFSVVKKIGPLRARIAWRFFQNPSSLLYKCLASKYGIDIWNGKHRNGKSAACSIILDGTNFLKPIVKWKIGKGTSINIMNDVWLLDKCFNKWPILEDCVNMENLTLNNFILEDGNWNLTELKQFFNDNLVNLIVHNGVIHAGDDDHMELLYQHSGKSISSLAYAESTKSLNPLDDSGFTAWLRKLHLRPRIELFWWRLGKFAIPTNEFLMYRRIGNTDRCAIGCSEVKSSAHVVVHCKFLIDIIKMLRSWGINVPIYRSLADCLYHLRHFSNCSLDIARIYCTAFFYSWNGRNNFKHGGPLLPTSVIAANVLFMATNRNSMLVNWDASLHCEFDPSCIGGVVRDSMDKPLLAFGKQQRHWDINQLELEAIFSLKDFIAEWIFDSKGLIIEGDNYNVIKFLQDYMKKSMHNNQISEKISFLLEFNKGTASRSERNGREHMGMDNNLRVSELDLVMEENVELSLNSNENIDGDLLEDGEPPPKGKDNDLIIDCNPSCFSPSSCYYDGNFLCLDHLNVVFYGRSVRGCGFRVFVVFFFSFGRSLPWFLSCSSINSDHERNGISLPDCETNFHKQQLLEEGHSY
ncbi:uncharacterized protein LOC110116069 [Dendrobium catenatum]|uniref:uncharacterized protein LOC110116069 n=1 Tax=Dendrobium catenatum TaxID=906689 RepID=UPI0010A09792|nr:uncharacterized protein LOC110116069 [Dendrobium catenatum]